MPPPVSLFKLMREAYTSPIEQATNKNRITWLASDLESGRDMPKFGPEHYLPAELYAEALEVFHVVAGIILFEFARQDHGKRDIIICNFIARTDMTVRAIFRLWDIQDYQDCWILHRCLLDRLFHLNHLQEHNQFEVFEEWSFLEQYNALNRVRSDPEFSGALTNEMFSVSSEQKERVKALSKNPPVWQRPKAEEVAKRMNMQFLYRFGYDYGSRHVHPMANDGQQDFFTITKLEPTQKFPDQRSVLCNTLLVGTMIMQEGLNASTPSWRALVYDFLDSFRKFLDRGSDDYKIKFLQMTKLVEQRMHLCKKANGSSENKGAV